MSLGAGGLFEAVREQNPEHQPSARLRKLCSTRGFEASSPWFLMPPPLIHAAANCAKARQAENKGHCGDGEVPGSPSNHVIAVCSLALTGGARGQAASPPANCTAPRRRLRGEAAAPQTDRQQAASSEHIPPRSGQWHCCANEGGGQKKSSSNRETVSRHPERKPAS